MARSCKFSTSTPLVDVHGQQSWKIDRLGLVRTWEWSVISSLVIFVILGFGLRVHQLGASGFAEDEMLTHSGYLFAGELYKTTSRDGSTVAGNIIARV